MMFSEGRATRSRRMPADSLESNLKANMHILHDSMLTPPMSQQDDERKGLRRGRSSFRQIVDTSIPKKTRYGAGGNNSLIVSTGASDPSLTTFESDDVNLDDITLDLWPAMDEIDALSSHNDPMMYNASADAVDSTSGNRTSDLHTPTPPRSPDMLNSEVPTPMMHRPNTPTIRPGTPGDMGNPLTPSPMDTSIVTSSLESDASLVESSSIMAYGPPPTPMCPPARVGNLSSSPLCVQLKLPLSTCATTTSALPPVNILVDSEEEEDDDFKDNDDDDNNTGTYNPTHINNNNNITTSSEFITISKPLIMMTETSNNSSPPSPESTLSKHSHRLRIRAPPSRSCRPSSISKPKRELSKGTCHTGGEKASQSKLVTKPVIKIGSTTTSSSENNSSKLKLNFLKRVERATSSDDVRVVNIHDGVGGRVGSTTPHQNSRKPPINPYSQQALKALLFRPSPSVDNNIPPTKVATEIGKGAKEKVVVSTSSSETSISTTTASPCHIRPNVNPHTHSSKKQFMRDGCFKSLHLKNFMTHKDLGCEWKGNVIFINGNNGSGKSAILNGIQLLFGHKAANTNRTTTVTGFIKSGCKFSLIQGRLHNRKPTLPRDTYPEDLILSRQISISGNTTYRINVPNSDKERVISYREVVKIRTAFQIDPNNPIQFLQQERNKENARRGSSFTLKRDFQLMKDATHLSDSEALINEAKENFDATAAEIEEKEEHLKLLILQTNQLKNKCDLIEKFEKSEGKIKSLQNELAWSEVQEWEEQQRDTETRKEEQYLEIEDLKKDIKQLKDKKENHIAVREKLKKMVTSIKSEATQYTRDEEAKRKSLRETGKTLVRVVNDRDRIEKAIKGYKQKISELEEQEEEDTPSFEQQNQSYHQEIEKWSGLIPEKEKQLEKCREEADNILAEINKFREREKMAELKIKKLKAEEGKLNKELNKRDTFFGRGIKELERRIERTQWQIKPVGPLGDKIAVKDEMYAPIIEYILSPATLCAYVVQTTGDFNKLKLLLGEIWPDDSWGHRDRKPAVIRVSPDSISKYMRKLSITENILSDYTTVLSLLTTKDPMVKVGLVESKSCEKIVIFENFKEAAKIAKQNGVLPKEVTAAYAPAITNRTEWYKVTPAPNYKVNPILGVKRTTDIIPMATEDAAVHIRQEIAREKEVMKTCQENLKGYNDGMMHRHGLEHLRKSNEGKIKDLNEEIYQYRNKIKYFQNMINLVPVQKEDKNLEKQIKDEQDRIAEQESKLQVRLQEVELANEAKAKLEKEIETLKNQATEAQGKLKEIDKEYSDALDIISKIEREEAEYDSKLKPLQAIVHTLNCKETVIEEEMMKKTKEAEATGGRPAILKRRPSDVKRDIEELETMLTSKRELVQSKHIIVPEYHNKIAQVKEFGSQLKGFKYINQSYEPYLNVVQYYLEKEKSNISNMLETNFAALVEHHGLTGKLIVEWSQQMLIYYVSPDELADERARKNFSNFEGKLHTDLIGILNYIRSLSGGEFSKSKAFLLLSLWEILDSPCFFVDEFETFMDEASRITIQQLFIKHSRKHTDKQFFFFTPQVLVGVPTDSSVSVFYLEKINSTKKKEGESNATHANEESSSKSRRKISSQKRLAIEDVPSSSSRKRIRVNYAETDYNDNGVAFP